MEAQRSAEWFEKRRGRVTGSQVGAILGVNPYKSADDVMRQMVRDYHGADSEFQGNVATEHGQFHESGAQAEYEMETGNKIEETGLHIHPGLEWLAASPDGLIGEEGVAEIKCPYGQRDKNPPQFKTAKDQPHYYAQMQIEMACTARAWCDFYQWAPHGSKKERVYRDEAWLSWALPLLREFYERFLKEIDNPEHLKPKRVEISTLEASRLVDEYDDLMEAIDRANERKKAVLSRLVEIAKEQDADIMGRKLTKVDRKGNVSYAKVIKDHCPDVDVEPYRGKKSSFWKLS